MCEILKVSIMDLRPGRTALYLPGELEGGVAAEFQHILQLLRSGGDQRNRLLHPTILLLLIFLQLPQPNDELRLCGINQAWRRRSRLRFESWRETLKHHVDQTSAEFTCRAYQGGAGQVIGVMCSVHPCDVPTHRCPNQMERSFIQTDTLHKLHKQRETDRCNLIYRLPGEQQCIHPLSASVQCLQL